MSASEGNQADSHADDHAEAQDHGPPTPPEPNTPMWLPAVGALLFLTAGLAWALTTPPAETADTSAIPAGSATATATAAATATATATATHTAAPAPPALSVPRQVGTMQIQPLPPGDKRRR
ncbi:MAG: hypothetical protein QOI41_4812 [Myxococcales bacterium]|nr:hypothetical protein [Myxococcales bacterium]